MACECLEKSDKAILEGLQKQHPERTYEPSQYGDSGFHNVSFSLSGGGRMVYFPYKSRYTFVKTNGQISAPRTENISIYPTFCPFCGVKRVEDEAEEG